MITEQVDITNWESAKLVIENIIEKKNVIIDGDQEERKKGVMMD